MSIFLRRKQFDRYLFQNEWKLQDWLDQERESADIQIYYHIARLEPPPKGWGSKIKGKIFGE